MRGKFIILDGIDGSGTTTQASALSEILRDRGHKVHQTKEPSTGLIGRVLREQLGDPKGIDHTTMALLFAADRVDHIRQEVLPALEAGFHVVCDRYLLSSLAYQSLHHRERWILEINRLGSEGAFSYLAPNLTFFFRISAEEAYKRVAQRAGTPERFDELEIQHLVAANYESAVELMARDVEKGGWGETIAIVDGAKPIRDLTKILVSHCVEILHL